MKNELAIGVQQILSTDKAFAAVKSDGSVITWGASNRGGDSTAVKDDIASGVRQIYSMDGGGAFAVLKSDGSVITWVFFRL